METLVSTEICQMESGSLRFIFGPGYRVYYTERGGALIVLLAGGDKSTQAKDINAAIGLAKKL